MLTKLRNKIDSITMGNDSVTRQTNGVVSTQQIDASKPTLSWNHCKCCGRSTNIGFAAVRKFSKVFVVLQTFGGLIATGVMALLTYEFIPAGSFSYRETAAIALFQTTPALVLVLTLFSLQVMGLIDLWLKMVLGIISIGGVILVILWVTRLLMLLPSISEVAS